TGNRQLLGAERERKQQEEKGTHFSSNTRTVPLHHVLVTGARTSHAHSLQPDRLLPSAVWLCSWRRSLLKRCDWRRAVAAEATEVALLIAGLTSAYIPAQQAARTKAIVGG